eukprot:2234182-Prymnesium_polylepis.1
MRLKLGATDVALVAPDMVDTVEKARFAALFPNTVVKTLDKKEDRKQVENWETAKQNLVERLE